MAPSYTQCVLDEIDWVIRERRHYHVHDFPIDYPEAEGVVKPILSTYDDKYGLVFILKITPENERSVFISVPQDDGGWVMSRSKLSDDPETLMFDSSEGWVEI